MNYQTEFPDFPEADMVSIPEGFTDDSWNQDVCPHFLHEASGIVLWVDYADPALREIPSYKRFRVCQCLERDPGHGWVWSGGELFLFDSDDWALVERALPNFIADMPDELGTCDTPEEAARIVRLRNNLTTPSDARILLAENAAARMPCPDLDAALQQIIREAGE